MNEQIRYPDALYYLARRPIDHALRPDEYTIWFACLASLAVLLFDWAIGYHSTIFGFAAIAIFFALTTMLASFKLTNERERRLLEESWRCINRKISPELELPEPPPGIDRLLSTRNFVPEFYQTVYEKFWNGKIFADLESFLQQHKKMDSIERQEGMELLLRNHCSEYPGATLVLEGVHRYLMDELARTVAAETRSYFYSYNVRRRPRQRDKAFLAALTHMPSVAALLSKIIMIRKLLGVRLKSRAGFVSAANIGQTYAPGPGANPATNSAV